MDYNENEMVTVTLERWEEQKESYELGENLKGAFDWHGYSGDVAINLDKVSVIARKYTQQPVVTFTLNGKKYNDLNSVTSKIKDLESRINELRSLWGKEEIQAVHVLDKTLEILDRPL